MQIDTIIEYAPWHDADLSGLARQAAAATLDHLHIDQSTCTLSVLGCDDARIATLNADFRGKPSPTNVLSWPETELSNPGGIPAAPSPDLDGDIALGDIAIAYETCRREADQQGKELHAHVMHLIVHATLHLLGYDHGDDIDATRMERIEVEVLGKLGLPDPY